MSGRGPAPGANPNRKDPGQRRRRNKPKPLEKLPPDHVGPAPPLPKTYRAKVQTEDGPQVRQVTFLQATREWYDDWAQSSMAQAGKLSRVHWRRLRMLAKTIDRYERDPSNLDALKEIRLQEAGFGGTPMDARRLGFEIGDKASPAPTAEQAQQDEVAAKRRERLTAG